MQVNAHMVIIEVTRRCNMSCDHCLRGEAESKDLSKEYIDKFFSQFDYIGEITFTGGEPSLVPHIIEYALESAKRQGVGVGSFYIVTNGKYITETFTVACLKWYAYCEDNECSGVELSQDDFHDEDREFKILKGLSIFSERSHTDYDNVIPQGRAADWGQGHIIRREEFAAYNDGQYLNIDEGMLYLNCNGELIGGCDWSYENQPNHKICDVGCLSVERLKTFGAYFTEE